MEEILRCAAAPVEIYGNPMKHGILPDVIMSDRTPSAQVSIFLDSGLPNDI